MNYPSSLSETAPDTLHIDGANFAITWKTILKLTLD